MSTTAGAQLAVETSSASICRAEQRVAGFASTHDGKTFARFYGTNASDSNAFGRCVSLKTEARVTAQAGQTSASAEGPQSTPPPSPTMTTTPASTDLCTGGSGKPNRLMPNDCVPGGPSGGLP
jgi:hypothetical protein